MDNENKEDEGNAMIAQGKLPALINIYDCIMPNSFFNLTITDSLRVRQLKLLIERHGLPFKMIWCQSYGYILAQVEKALEETTGNFLLDIRTYDIVDAWMVDENEEECFYRVRDDLPVPIEMHEKLLELVEKVKKEYINWLNKKTSLYATKFIQEPLGFLYFDEKSMTLDKYASAFTFDLLESMREIDAANVDNPALKRVFSAKSVIARLEIVLTFFSGDIKLNKQKGNIGF